MLMCKGKGCNWRRQCSRYVLGRAAKAVDVTADWMDHCLQHQQKFIRIGWADGEGPVKMQEGKV